MIGFKNTVLKKHKITPPTPNNTPENGEMVKRVMELKVESPPTKTPFGTQVSDGEENETLEIETFETLEKFHKEKIETLEKFHKEKK